MAGRGLGGLFVTLFADTSKFSKDIQGAGRQIKTFGSDGLKVSNAFSAGFKGAMGAATAAIVALGVPLSAGGVILGLKRLVQGAADAGDNFAKMSTRVGVSVETLSALSHAAGLSGSSMEDVEKGLRTVSQRLVDADQGLAEAKRSFEALGISIRDGEGNLKAADAVLFEFADKMKGLATETERTALAQELFGRAGTGLLPMLKDGSAGLREMMDEAKALGITWSGPTAKAAEDFNDSLTRLGGAFTGVKNLIARELFPVLTPLIDRFKDWVVTNRELIGMRVAEFMRGLLAAAVALAPAMQTVFLFFKNTAVIAAGLLSSSLALSMKSLKELGAELNANTRNLEKNAAAFDTVERDVRTFGNLVSGLSLDAANKALLDQKKRLESYRADLLLAARAQFAVQDAKEALERALKETSGTKKAARAVSEFDLDVEDAFRSVELLDEAVEDLTEAFRHQEPAVDLLDDAYKRLPGTLDGVRAGLAPVITGFDLGRQAGQAAFQGITDSVFNLAKGLGGLKEVWTSVLDSMLRSVIDFMASKAVNSFLSFVFGAEAGGGGGGGGLLSGLAGSGLASLATSFFTGGASSLATDAGFISENAAGLGALPGIGDVLSPVTKVLKKIPLIGGLFQEGTPFVPRDMLAVVHRGEAVIPAAANPFAGGRAGGDTFNIHIDARGRDMDEDRLAKLIEARIRRIQRARSTG